MTQPALSNGVARLERRLGGRLFDRSPRGVSVTAFGRAVMPLIDQAVSGMDAVLAEARRWHAPSTTAVRVGVSPLVDPRLVARIHGAVRDLSDTSAPRQLILHEANLAELRAALAAGELDLVVGPAVGPVPLHEQSIIDSEPLVLVDADREAEVRVELTDLADKQLILLPDTCGLTTFTHSLLRDHGLQVNAYPGEASNYRVLEEWSRLGLGAALLPESKLAEPHAPHRTVYETDGTTVEVYYEAVWDPTGPMAAIMRDLADRVHRTAR